MAAAAYQTGLRLLGLAVLLAAGSLAAAWFSELVLGYLPCKLCLWQRWPYYIGLPFGALALLMAWTGADRRVVLGLGALFLLCFAAGLGLGVYHAGVEWKWWAGPAECGGRILAAPASVEDFRRSLSTARVLRCDEAPFRILGVLSFAGLNVVASLAVLGLAAAGLPRSIAARPA